MAEQNYRLTKLKRYNLECTAALSSAASLYEEPTVNLYKNNR